jgi:hypothetical protein
VQQQGRADARLQANRLQLNGGVLRLPTSMSDENTTPIEDGEIARLIENASRQLRPYASFFHWPQREVSEWGVVAAFAEAAKLSLPFRDLRSRSPGHDPPDCEALDAEGRPLALEVTELVDGEAIAQAKRTNRVLWAKWDRGRFLKQLQARLTEKDAKVLNGEPYNEYIVLVHTDEPMLPADTVEDWLSGHVFTAPIKINRAYLLLSYDPGRNGYPYFRLRS